MLIHRYELPDRFVAGTVGPPGERTFFLQARQGGRMTSVALEKQQVLVLAEQIEHLLDRVAEQTGDDPRRGVTPTEDDAPLDQPIEEEFRVGGMTLTWDEDARIVVIEAFSVTETDPTAEEAEAVVEAVVEDDEPDADEALVVSMVPAMALAFANRARLVVSAGRPQCTFCGQPMEADGHLCPRANGFKRVAAG